MMLSNDKRAELRKDYADDARVIELLDALGRSDGLLKRSLYEFGSELRIEIERYLGEPPLLPGGG